VIPDSARQAEHDAKIERRRSYEDQEKTDRFWCYRGFPSRGVAAAADVQLAKEQVVRYGSHMADIGSLIPILPALARHVDPELYLQWYGSVPGRHH